MNKTTRTILTHKPKKWRDGQTMFNFLEWLCYQKGYEGNQNIRMADPFHISDNEMSNLYNEFLKDEVI